MSAKRPDGHSWFNLWFDAYHQALFRADLTGRRYRVWFEPNNRWWNIAELSEWHR